MVFHPSSAAPGPARAPQYLQEMAEWTGLEPATPGVTGRYSNQLNYHSASWWVLRGSNPRPSPCKGDALPAELSTPLEEGREYTRGGSAWLDLSRFPLRRAAFPRGAPQGRRRSDAVNPRVALLMSPDLRLAARRLAAALLAGNGLRRLSLHDRQRHRQVRQSRLQHVVDPFDRANIQFFLDVVGDLGQILDVVVRDQDRADTAAVRGQQLFFQSADRQHFSAHCDLAGHRHIRTHRDLGQGGNERGTHAHAGARTILGRGALGNVNGHVGLLIEVHLEPEHGRPAGHHGHGGLNGFLYHFTGLAGGGGLA